MPRLSKNIKLLFKYILAPLLAGWLFYSLYRQIKGQPLLSESWVLIKNTPVGPDAWKFWLVFILVFINWGIEALKWKYLMKPLENMPFGRALRSVFSGVTLSINTPNRIGEYGGRMLYVGKGNKLKSISLSIAGSISQLIITLSMGCLGLLFMLFFVQPDHETIMGLSWFWVRVLLTLTVVITLMIILFFFKMSWLIKTIGKLPAAVRIIPYIKALESFDIKLLLSLLLMSFFRYIILILQYVLLWQALGVNIGTITGIYLLAVLFLVLSIVPSFAIADLGIRGQFSVALIGIYSSNTIGIITATFGIWILNLFIPALVGSIMILGIKFFKEKEI